MSTHLNSGSFTYDFNVIKRKKNYVQCYCSTLIPVVLVVTDTHIHEFTFLLSINWEICYNIGTKSNFNWQMCTFL